MAFCVQVASTRRIMTRGLGINNMTVGKDFMDVEIMGVLGEFAFAKFCNVFPKFIDRVKSGGEDCVYKGNRIDVKASRKTTNGIFVTRKNDDIDIYVQTHVDGNVVTILGWIESHVVTQEQNKGDDGCYRYYGKLNKHKIERKVKHESRC